MTKKNFIAFADSTRAKTKTLLSSSKVQTTPLPLCLLILSFEKSYTKHGSKMPKERG